MKFLNKENSLPEKPRGFSLQLFWVILLPLIVFLLVVVFSSYSLHHQAMRTLVGDRNLRALRAASGGLSEQLASLEFDLESISLNLQQEANISQPDGSVGRLTTPFSNGVALFAQDGRLLFTSSPGTDLERIAINSPGLWDSIRSAPPDERIQIRTVMGGEDPSIIMATVQTGGRVLLGSFPPSALARRTFDELQTGGQVTLMVIDRDRNVLYLHEGLPLGDDPSSHAGVAEALAGGSGLVDFSSGHDHHVVAYTPVSPPGWALVMIESWDESTGSTLNATQAAPLILIPVLVFVLVVLWFGSRQIVQPILKLRAQAAELGRGNFSAVEQPVGGINEVRALQVELVGMADKLKIAQENLRQYIGAITSGIESERRSLARELHDDTLQSLIVLNQQVFMLDDPAAAENTPCRSKQEIQPLVSRAIENLRRMVRGLRPPYLEDLGLGAALKMLIKEVEAVNSLEMIFIDNSHDRRLPLEVETAFYRIAQEALNNAVRHAQADRLELRLEIEPSGGRLSVFDNGSGFIVPERPEHIAARGHFGLLGMVERAELSNLDLNIRSTPGGGTIIAVEYKTPPLDGPLTQEGNTPQ